jgi:hypothetical protein
LFNLILQNGSRRVQNRNGGQDLMSASLPLSPLKQTLNCGIGKFVLCPKGGEGL